VFSPDEKAVAAEADLDLRIGFWEWVPAGDGVAGFLLANDEVPDPVCARGWRVGFGLSFVLTLGGWMNENGQDQEERGQKTCGRKMLCFHSDGLDGNLLFLLPPRFAFFLVVLAALRFQGA
jgi:hypothetical protein